MASLQIEMSQVIIIEMRFQLEVVVPLGGPGTMSGDILVVTTWSATVT